ncbi:unnamed protein product [Ilex paraguariensis]|uniref:Uncharacterized protein n=1 Tax=Ilex paraguariensis TaxID=185542 RepID=A0ABC8SGE4_9AQUA
MSTFSQTPNRGGVLSESKRITSAHSPHFLALSLLFLLPLSSSPVIYGILQFTFSQNDDVNDQFFRFSTSTLNHLLPETLVFPLLFALFVIFFSVCAIATITYSTFHGFYGRPVRFIHAIRSISSSFLPLASTIMTSQAIIALICTICGLFVVLLYQGLQVLGVEIDYKSNCFIGFCIFVVILLGSTLIWLQLNWVLTSVIAVVESKWGIEPLRRSTQLVMGMRGTSLQIVLSGVSILFMILGNYLPAMITYRNSGLWSWDFMLTLLLQSSFVVLFMLLTVAENTVMYLYCKALNGESAIEMAKEFTGE